jgi:hypothetical protein
MMYGNRSSKNIKCLLSEYDTNVFIKLINQLEEFRMPMRKALLNKRM